MIWVVGRVVHYKEVNMVFIPSFSSSVFQITTTGVDGIALPNQASRIIIHIHLFHYRGQRASPAGPD